MRKEGKKPTRNGMSERGRAGAERLGTPQRSAGLPSERAYRDEFHLRVNKAVRGVSKALRVFENVIHDMWEDMQDAAQSAQLCNPIIAALEKQTEALTAALKESMPVYFVDPPKDATLDPQDCPVDGKGGFWETQKDYADRIGIKSSTLTAYRKASEGARWSSCGEWGESKRGKHIFKKINPDDPNSEFQYWVCDK